MCLYSNLMEMQRWERSFCNGFPSLACSLLLLRSLGLLSRPLGESLLLPNISQYMYVFIWHWISGLGQSSFFKGTLWEYFSVFTCGWRCVMFSACDIANLASCPPASDGKSKQFREYYRLLIKTRGFVFSTKHVALVMKCTFAAVFVLRW